MSEGATPLAIQTTTVTRVNQLPSDDGCRPDVWLFMLPSGRTIADSASLDAWVDHLRRLCEKIHRDSLVSILTTCEDAAQLLPGLSELLRYHLWVAVKVGASPAESGTTALPQTHAALLVLSKYQASLRHSKTRIGYTFCPACDKTTKDYGGKKHTYHEYGTLVSDVWRDAEFVPGRRPDAILERMRDLFGVPPHQTLRFVDLTHWRTLKPTKRVAGSAPQPCSGALASPLRSELKQGDCIEVLKSIPAGSVDFCFADPPYNLAKRYDTWNDAIELRDYFRWCDRWLDELARVLRPGRTCAVLNIPLWSVRHFEHLRKRLSFQNWIVWEGLSLPVRMIMPAHYSILCFSKGPPRPLPGLIAQSRTRLEQEALSPLAENYCLRSACIQKRRSSNGDRAQLTDLWWDVHRLKHNSRRVDHPCQLPPNLMRRLVALFTEPGEIVLDPFDGAGTTTLCAAELDRRFIGIELSEKYHRLALERHELLKRGGNPFEKGTGIPTAKNSRVKRIGQTEYRVPKKTLQLDVRRIACELGRLPSRDEVATLSRFPIRYFDEYFISWGEVCAAARTTGMSEDRPGRENHRGVQLNLFG